MSLKELYQEIILDHGKKPRHHGRLDQPSHCHEGHNPLCGDQLMLYIKTANDKIDDICFEGKGCAISIASASIMSETVKGKTLSEVYLLFDRFHHLVTGKFKEEKEADIGKLSVFSGVAEFPIRIKCATLAWHTLKAALADASQQPATTETSL